jgi:putative sigma-54 modulation protein
MKINIKGTNIELTPAITQYVEKKVGMVDKYLENVSDVVAHVEVGKSTQHHKSGDVFRAEVHIVGAGVDLYAAIEQSDLYAAIDLVKDEVVGKATSLKGKKATLSRRGGQMIKDAMKGLNFFKKRG